MIVAVPAKVNLFLRVVRRRGDGYHELETVMQSVSLVDELSLAPAPELRLACNFADLPPGPENLVWKAAEALRAHCGLPPECGAAIEILRRRVTAALAAEAFPAPGPGRSFPWPPV